MTTPLSLPAIAAAVIVAATTSGSAAPSSKSPCGTKSRATYTHVGRGWNFLAGIALATGSVLLIIAARWGHFG